MIGRRSTRSRKPSALAVEAEETQALLGLSTPAAPGELPAFDEDAPKKKKRGGGGSTAKDCRRGGRGPKRSAAEIEQAVAALADAEANSAAMIATTGHAARPSVLAHVLPVAPPSREAPPDQQTAPVLMPLAQTYAEMSAEQPKLMSLMMQGLVLPFQGTAAISTAEQLQPMPSAVPAPHVLATSTSRVAIAAAQAAVEELEEEDEVIEVAEACPKKKNKSKHQVLTEATTAGLWMIDPALLLIYRSPACTSGGSGSSRVAAFTLDGAICMEKQGCPSTGNTTTWQWANDRVPRKIAQLVSQGYTVAIFNNQGNIKGALTGKASLNARQKVDAMLAELAQLQGVDTEHIKVLLAPQINEMRKPNTGMWQFFTSFCNGGMGVDLPQSFYVGCDPDDKQFATAVGLKYEDGRSFFRE